MFSRLLSLRYFKPMHIYPDNVTQDLAGKFLTGSAPLGFWMKINPRLYFMHNR